MNASDRIRIIKKILSSSFIGKMNIITVEIALTYRCNLKCAYCELSVFEKNGPEKEMSTDQLKDTFRKLELLGTERINISGGEPLLREDISEILEHAFQRKFRVSLTTNGVFVPQYINLLKGLERLILSLDGDKTTHDSLRGNGVHAAALNALDLCCENGVDILISSVVTSKTTENDLLYLLDICERYNVRCIIQPMTCGAYIDNSWVRFKKADELRPSYNLIESLRRLLKKDPRKHMIIGGEYYLKQVLSWYRRIEKNTLKELKCLAGKLFLSVSPGGKLLVCSMRCEDVFGKNILESSVADLKMIRPRSIKCKGCSCYSYMILNDISKLNLRAVLHCIGSNY